MERDPKYQRSRKGLQGIEEGCLFKGEEPYVAMPASEIVRVMYLPERNSRKKPLLKDLFLQESPKIKMSS